MPIVYDVFAGNSAGGPIDYTTPVATTSSLSATLSALALNSSTWFGVRARDTVSGYSDLNTDAQVMIAIDGAGNDVSARPNAPETLKATPKANGAILVEWAYPYPLKTPTGFRVYKGTDGTVSYGSPAATVPYSGRYGSALLTGLTGGTAYSIGVRSYSAAGEDPNTASVTATADTTPPGNVVSLTASLTA
jgi:hypothetical protein